MTTVLTVVGARPQFVKAGVLSRALRDRPDIDEVLVHTGQHHDPGLSAVFFDELEIRQPDFFLGVAGGGHGQMTGRMLAAIEPVILAVRPDVVIVYGDTNSTLAGVLAAVKLRILVAHVEAGLRSFDRRMPEEVNRVVADHLSQLLLCPTVNAVNNLAAEGVFDGVHHVGDVMYDATLHAAKRCSTRPSILARLGLAAGDYALLTVHRAESTDDPMMLQTVFDFARAEVGTMRVVFPIHPRTRQAVDKAGISLDPFVVIQPVSYLDMSELLASACMVMTDSGGLQKEAYFHRVPCITLRDNTEWIETVDAGWNRLWTQSAWASVKREISDYGTGDTGQTIVRLISSIC